MRTVLVIGTSHKYQLPDHVSSAAFRAFVEKCCVSFKPLSLAEEMSLEVLTQRQVAVSVCDEIAQINNMAHRYCDPQIEERAQLGIWSENDIRRMGFFEGWDESRIEEEVRASHQMRESYWLKEILALDSWPVLFVCGANHVAHFRMKLADVGINAKILASDWGPG